MRSVTIPGLAMLVLVALGTTACEDEAPPVGELPRVDVRPADTPPDPYAPRRTRAGFVRVSTEQVHDNPAATAVLLERLDREQDRELRSALVEALPRTGGPWVDQVIARLPAEPDPLVRKAMVAVMVRADPARAVRGIALGLDDHDAEVRTEAAVTAGSLPLEALRAADLVEALVLTLADDHGPVRSACARSLGILRAVEATDALASLQDDPEPPVRQQVGRALTRLDAPAGKALR